MKIAIIGGGNMGQAFARGLSTRDLAIEISNPSVDKITYLEDLGINVTNKNEEAINTAEIVVIAVKPNMVENVLKSLKFDEKQIILSVAAGVKISQLMNWSGLSKVVRVMPNTPALVGHGMCGWVCSEAIADDERLGIQELLATVGDEVEMKGENMMDAITAISGSGPAYVFYFLEAIAEAGKQLGLEEAVVNKLAIKTFLGASMLAELSHEDFSTLRERVTSKGGTTEAALKFMEESSIKQNFINAIKKAAKRSSELGEAN